MGKAILAEVISIGEGITDYCGRNKGAVEVAAPSSSRSGVENIALAHD